jgi:hypothetical protein
MQLTLRAVTALSSLGLLCLAGCTSVVSDLPSNDSLLQEVTGQNGRVCIDNNDINGFGYLDNDVISVDGRRGQYFLMTTLYRCNSLTYSPQIAFAGNFAEFCGGGRNKVITGEEICPIKSIYQFTSRKEAFSMFDIISEKREKLREELKEEQNKE